MFRMSRRLKRAVSLAMYIDMAEHFAHAAEAPMAIVEDILAPSSKLQVFCLSPTRNTYRPWSQRASKNRLFRILPDRNRGWDDRRYWAGKEPSERSR